MCTVPNKTHLRKVEYFPVKEVTEFDVLLENYLSKTVTLESYCPVRSSATLGRSICAALGWKLSTCNTTQRCCKGITEQFWFVLYLLQP